MDSCIRSFNRALEETPRGMLPRACAGLPSSHPAFIPSPTDNLPRYCASGDEPCALQVLIAEQDASYRQGGLLGRFEGAFLKATIGYGYRPLRTIGWSLLVVLFGWSVVWTAKREG